jgi:hypothetical protein
LKSGPYLLGFEDYFENLVFDRLRIQKSSTGGYRVIA